MASVPQVLHTRVGLSAQRQQNSSEETEKERLDDDLPPLELGEDDLIPVIDENQEIPVLHTIYNPALDMPSKPQANADEDDLPPLDDEDDLPELDQVDDEGDEGSLNQVVSSSSDGQSSNSSVPPKASYTKPTNSSLLRPKEDLPPLESSGPQKSQSSKNVPPPPPQRKHKLQKGEQKHAPGEDDDTISINRTPKPKAPKSIMRTGATGLHHKQVRFAPFDPTTPGEVLPQLFESPPQADKKKAHFQPDADGHLRPNHMGINLEEKSLPRPFTPSFRLDERVAIVTGGTKGIGFSIALALASLGASVLITSRNEPELRDAARKIQSISGGKCVHLKADVSKESENRRTINKALVEFGRLDILINNAAIGVPIGKNASSENFDSMLFQQQMGVNITGPFLLSRLAIPHISKSKAGRIINISSVQGNTGNPGTGGAYPYAKKALEEMTRVMARELGPNVTVNCVAPGLIRTMMAKRCWNADQIDHFSSTIPAQRLGKIEDVVSAVTFLTSDMASFVTGIVLPVDGGLTLHGS